MTSDPGRLHEPVMRERVVQLLAPALRRADSVLVDATLGMGGHAEALLAACPTARLIGIDRDPQALSLAAQRLAAFASRVELVHATSDTLVTVLQGLGLRVVNAVLLDLGVSSLQLDRPERGFAYAQDAELDMRMDQSAGTPPASCSRRPTRQSWPASCAATARNASPHGSRAPSSASAPAPRSPPAPSSWTSSVPASPPRRAAPGGTRPSAPSRRCGSP